MSADEHVKAQLTPQGKFALLLILCMLPTFGIFLFFDQPELGLGTCESIGVLLIALRATWTSVVTSKPAIRGHSKTGQRDWPKS
jgi:hypothetical protein